MASGYGNQLELVCKPREINDVASVISLRLTVGAFAVYLQLTAQESYIVDKHCWPSSRLTSFSFRESLLGSDESPDVFLALRKTIQGALLKYDELHTILCEIETRINDRSLVMLSRLPSVRTRIYPCDDTTSEVDHLIRRWQYQQRLTPLAELWRLRTLFGGVSEKALMCAFVAGLSENVRQLLRVGLRMEDLGLSQIPSRARAIITDERPVDALNTCLNVRGPGVWCPTVPPARRCYECGGPNHFARDCLARRQGAGSGKQNPPTRKRRWRRGSVVRAASRQGNEHRAEAAAPSFCLRGH
ncbi:hypothetical protein T10_9188 [Trichinella papuae]|uniref:CCHC-type domain-containing protein n=1 Tax=Trichinella papuae TaxID=268474 RepID=A0A0V1M1X1_9BILA|nr:hypothetical protein T10_9188 [Trichinella papuae]